VANATNASAQFRRFYESASREINTILTTAGNGQSQHSLGGTGQSSFQYRYMNQQILQTQNQIQRIAALVNDLEPKALECGSAEWAARSNMSKVVKDIEIGNFGWDLAATVAQEGFAHQMAAAASVHEDTRLGDGLHNLTLRL